MKNKQSNSIQETLSQSNRKRNNLILMMILVITLFTIGITWPFAFSFRLGILAQESRFNNEQFHKINASGITDNKGTITFIDDNLEVVYPKDSSFTITQQELDNMLDAEMVSQDIKTYTYEKDGITHTLIYSEGETPRTSWFLLIDEDNNYIESENFHYIQTSYTDTDVEYIINDYVKEARDYKYYFVSDQGNEFYMIINIDQRIVLFETYEIVIIVVSLSINVLLSFLLIRNPKRKLIKRLNQPISVLSHAMSNFNPGDNTTIDDFFGIEEYDSIIKTYNDLVQHINQLEDKNKTLEQNKKDMFAAIAHDLKTPITILNGYIDAMINGKIDKSEYENYYQKILSKSDQLTMLINEFATFNEMNHSNFKLRKTAEDINAFTRNYLAHNYQFIENANFTLDVEIPEEINTLEIDKNQLTRAFDNLISNFIKYNNPDTNIMVILKDDSESLILSFMNNGTKISDEIVHTMFDPFIIDDKSRTTSSTGLGLSITKRIIELHGGSIHYETDITYCNQFIITLPKQ